MTIAEFIAKLQTLPDHSRRIVITRTDIHYGSEETGIWGEDFDAEPDIQDLAAYVAIDGTCNV